jgi:hypothetical protein
MTTTKKLGKLLALLITMRMWWYDAGRITQLSKSRASLEATGCRYQKSANAVSPRRPSWLAILAWCKTQNTNKTELLPS